MGLMFTLDMFKQFLEKTALTYFPFVSDITEIKEVDIAIIEGCITNQDESQINLLKEIRKNSKKVIALGTCATLGGIINLNPEKQGEPISTFIDIDGMIPGCPPPTKLLGNALKDLLNGKEIILSDKNVCNNCPLRVGFDYNFQNHVYKLTPKKISKKKDDEQCFLKEGILCLGPITREGCESLCIKLGIPCEGCMGSIKSDFTSSLINFLSLINLSGDLRKYEGIYFRFSKPKIGGLSK
ncbi:MAG: hypothetical protein ACTSX4_14695 [Candidatus Helarchaeota archaeon]